MSKCHDKRKFRRFCQAVKAADQYMEEMALVLKPMVAYLCNKHRCFHIGHDYRMSEERIQQFTISSRQRSLSLGILDLPSFSDINYETYSLDFVEQETSQPSGLTSVDTIQGAIPVDEAINEFALI